MTTVEPRGEIAPDEDRVRPPLGTRAVLKEIVSGTDVACSGCAGRITFAPRQRASQVVCNVYEDGRWAHIEHYHEQCYADAGDPHGEVDRSQARRLGALRARAGHPRTPHPHRPGTASA